MREARVLVGPGRGHRFELPSHSLLRRMWNWRSVALGRYEPEVTAFLAERLRPARVFFDVGAHTGYYTRIALKLMDAESRVVAFEPDHDAAARMRRTLGGARLAVREEAVGREDHYAVLERREGVVARIRGESIAGTGYAQSTAVRVCSLDRLLAAEELPPPDLLKVNVEGGELLVLEGMCRLLEQQRPAMAVECHSMPLLRDVLELLIDHGYDHLRVTRGGDGVGPPTVLAATVPAERCPLGP